MTGPNDPKWKAMAERTTIIRADCGSRGFGVNTPTSDYDEKGVCIEDFNASCRLEGKFEQYNEKLPPTHVNINGATADYPGADIEIFSLEKFVRLALHGNPTILCILYATECTILDERGRALQALAPFLISRYWGKRFLGYMESQRQKLKGERGQKRVNRPELEEKYGYDTKYAMHLLRLGFQGVEVMTTGKMSMPLPADLRAYLMDVRVGKINFNDMLQKAGDLERELKDLIDNSMLPEEPDKEYVDTWVRSMYWENWQARADKELLITRADGLYGVH